MKGVLANQSQPKRETGIGHGSALGFWLPKAQA